MEKKAQKLLNKEQTDYIKKIEEPLEATKRTKK